MKPISPRAFEILCALVDDKPLPIHGQSQSGGSAAVFYALIRRGYMVAATQNPTDAGRAYVAARRANPAAKVG